MDPDQKLIEIKGLTYRPVGADHEILNDVNLDWPAGEFTLLLGPSGCGKSILTRCLNGLIPHLDEGELKGQVIVKGKDTRQNPIHAFSSIVGMVFQNPDDQILSLKVLDEVAWGVENLGLEQSEIVSRVDHFMEVLDIEYLRDRLTFAISGGQKQKVSIASNLAMQQDILILDDPTTDLDPVCKSEVIRVLDRLHKENKINMFVIEHDLNELIELSTSIIVMDKGRIMHYGKPDEILSQYYDELMNLGINIPQHVEIAHEICATKNCPESILVDKAGVFSMLEQFVEANQPLPVLEKAPSRNFGETAILVRNLSFKYSEEIEVLKDISFDVNRGEFLAIIGANGSGKSTLVNNLIGLLKPDSGEITINGRNTRDVKVSDLAKNIGYVFQNPDHQLFTTTVEQEVGFSLKMHKVPEEEAKRRIDKTLDIVGLQDYRNQHPFALSRGQRQKLAVATALVHEPSIILLDEPTTGQDRRSLKGLLDMMAELNHQGNTTIMITHDMDIVAAYATKVIVLAEGKIVLNGTPESIFFDHINVLNELNLQPPTTIDYCSRLEHKGLPRFMKVEDLCSYLHKIQVTSKLIEPL